MISWSIARRTHAMRLPNKTMFIIRLLPASKTISMASNCSSTVPKRLNTSDIFSISGYSIRLERTIHGNPEAGVYDHQSPRCQVLDRPAQLFDRLQDDNGLSGIWCRCALWMEDRILKRFSPQTNLRNFEPDFSIQNYQSASGLAYWI